MAKGDTNGKSHRLIEDNLKRVYQETLEEEVPDRFRDLLARLKQGETGDAANPGNSEGGEQ